MPGVIKELFDSRTFSIDQTGGSATFRYYIHGESDERAAYELVIANAPVEWYSFVRDTVDMGSRIGINQWMPVVNYSVPVFQPNEAPPPGNAQTDPPPSPPPPPAGGGGGGGGGESLGGVSFTIGLENQHVYKSLETIEKKGKGGAAAADFKRLIGVTADGKVEGVDIGVPVATINRRVTLPYLSVDYFKNLIYLVGRTNADPWWLFSYEEGLFVGASGQDKGGGGFEVNFEFKYSATKKNIVIRPDDPAGTGITIVEKKGWHYLWVAYKPEIDTVANAMVERPVAAYVERVYDTGGFSWLGI